MDWEKRFQDNSTPWERPGLHPAARDWINQDVLVPGQRVLIPGCGRSPELVQFADRGLAVTGFDLSATAIDWQRAALDKLDLTADLIKGDGLAWTPEALFDLIYEQTFLCAIPPRLRHSYEACAHRWLKSGGKFLALFMQKDERGGPPYGCSLDAMHELFPAERWIWPEDTAFKPYPHPNLNGKPELGGILTRR